VCERCHSCAGRQVVKATACTYHELPVDGVVELWFNSTEELDDAFSSPPGVQTMKHAQSFIDEIATFIVESRKVI
jgi:hypothetical protein